MNHTPSNSNSVKKKENTFISPLTLYLEKNKMNMDQQVRIRLTYFAVIPISRCVPKLNAQTLEPESIGSNPGSPIYQLYVTLDK